MLAASSAASGHAQSAPTDSVAPPPEEITVTGERSLYKMHLELGRATESFWSLVNDTLDDKEFKVTCRREVPTGTLIAERVCRARFQHDEQSMEASAWRQGWTYDPAAPLAEKNRVFVDKVVAAVNASPDLNKAVAELERLKASYEAAARALAASQRAAD